MKSPVKVLILETVMDRGGAEAMTMNYFRHLDKSKVTYDFLVHRDYKAAYEEEIESLGGKIYRICPPFPQNYFRYCKQIRSFFKEHPEYRILHSNMMDLSFFAFKEASKAKIPVRILHSHISQEKGRIGPKEIVHKIYKKNVLRYTTHRLACGIEAGKWLYGNNSDFHVLHNAIEANKFRYSEKIEEEVRNEFNLNGKFVVGHVGRFFEQKNHPFIIDIFNGIAQKDNTAVLMLVGGGEIDDVNLKKTIKKVEELGLKDRVIFTGVREDVNRIMQAFDVFILPSLYEGLPVVMIEAQSAGLKCVMSDSVPEECAITGNVEIISLNESALHWADRILSYKNSYKKKDMYDEIVRAGYDIKSNVKWLEEFYLKAGTE